MRALAAALLLTASAAGASAAIQNAYFVQAGALACGDAVSLARATPATPGCRYLPANTRAAWDGRRIEGLRPPAFDGDKARVTIEGRPLFVYANFLAQIPFADPLRRDFTLAHATVACASHLRLDEALAAFGRGDRHWLSDAECIAVPAGTHAVRAEPAVAATESIWRVRLELTDRRPQTLWMLRDDFR